MAGTQGMQAEHQKQMHHSYQIDNRKHARINGVCDVLSFHENEIVLKVDSGLMVIAGEKLHIDKLLLDEGRLDVDGRMDSVIYEAPNASVKRLFRWTRKNK